MKIAFDVDVIRDLGISKMVQQVADWGYRRTRRSIRSISIRKPAVR
jgi:myo-inositol catabolism protein IolH